MRVACSHWSEPFDCGCRLLTFALAADEKRQAPPPAAPSLLSEFRFGFSAQDPWGPESGSANVTGEILFAKPFTPADLFTSYFVPAPASRRQRQFRRQDELRLCGPHLVARHHLAILRRGQRRRRGPQRRHASRSQRPRPRGARLLAAVSRSRIGRCAALRQLEHDGDARAPVEWRRPARDNRGLTNIGARVGYTSERYVRRHFPRAPHGRIEPHLHPHGRQRHDGARGRRTAAEIRSAHRGIRHSRRDQCLPRHGAAAHARPRGRRHAGAHPERPLRPRRRSCDRRHGKPLPYEPLRIVEAQVERLEREIDTLNAALSALRSFVLPGGTAAAAALHLARTVCRRAERLVVELSRAMPARRCRPRR